jgi:hypothetical protein
MTSNARCLVRIPTKHRAFFRDPRDMRDIRDMDHVDQTDRPRSDAGDPSGHGDSGASVRS